MVKQINILFASVVFFLSVNAYGQQQNDFLESLTTKFRKYCEAYPREEIYVHTDRHEYIAGEDFWFGIYLFDRQSSLPSSDSKIAYFEIINSENRPVIQKRIRIDNGFGPGQIVLPDSLSSGVYTIRAYTNWMKNFLPENCFTGKLIIYNALIEKGSGISDRDQYALSNIVQSVQEDGFKADINNLNPKYVEIEIKSDGSFLSKNRVVYIFVQTHGLINFKNSVTLSGEVTTAMVPRDQLIPGLNHITIFNSAEKPICEKYIFTPSSDSSLLSLESSGTFKTRDKVSIEIKNELDPTKSLVNLSMSVSPQSESLLTDIEDYMIFGSEFGVLPLNSTRSAMNDMPEEALGNYLSALQSNWINWNSILSGDFPERKYDRETESHFIYGRLLKLNTQIPESNHIMYLSIPGKEATFQYATTDINGDFHFAIPLEGNYKDFIIQPENGDEDFSIKIETSFSDKYPEKVTLHDTFTEDQPNTNSKLGINYQVMKIFSSENLSDEQKPVIFTGDSKRFYGKPDIELVMSDYIKLPSMEEVFFELIPGVFLRKKKGGYEITLIDQDESKAFEKPPLVFVDGVVIRDAAVIANLDPDLVEKIDAVSTKYVVGYYLIHGLVNIITKAGDFSSITLPDYAVRLGYNLTEPVSSFTCPDYSLQADRNNHIPDFRNTLYWNPSIKPDTNGKMKVEFSASDYVSDYIVRIQGLAKNGKPVSISKLIKIEK